MEKKLGDRTVTCFVLQNCRPQAKLVVIFKLTGRVDKSTTVVSLKK